VTTAPKDAEPSTRAANAAIRAALPFEDRRDFADARRGLIATLPDGIARAASGQVVWNLSDYEFLAAEEAPATVNPSLWRMAQLNRVSGLFQVIDRIYQLRGLDLANMTIIEGDTGLIVIDTLLTCEAAKPKTAGIRQSRGNRAGGRPCSSPRTAGASRPRRAQCGGSRCACRSNASQYVPTPAAPAARGSGAGKARREARVL
jgi:alkyl sulfatase BDS1-like metallo-beta-lactamase superfamily hydrolase